jgi:hypothetical protein
MLKYLLAATAALTLAAPGVAQAQDIPSYAQQSANEQIRGRVTSFDGAYNLTVQDERGFTDNVQLHDGTIINPTGLTLAPGMVVSILGQNDGDVLAANEVDTPYQFDNAVAYYGGRPWNDYGPTIGLSFFFGNTGWWHGNDFGGGFHYDRGARVYENVRIDDRTNVVNRVSVVDRYSARTAPVTSGYTGSLRPNPGNMTRFAAPVYRAQARNVNVRAQAPVERANRAPSVENRRR